MAKFKCLNDEKEMLLSDDFGSYCNNLIKDKKVIMHPRLKVEEKKIIGVISYMRKGRMSGGMYFDQMLYSSCGMDNLLDDRDKDYPPFVDIYDEETEEVIETEFMKRIETAKQEGKLKYWFVSSDYANREGPLEIEFLEWWQKQNPEYSFYTLSHWRGE